MSIHKLINQLFKKILIVPLVALTVVIFIFAILLSNYIDNSHEQKNIASFQNVIKQSLLNGDYVQLNQQITALAKSDQWIDFAVVDSQNNVILNSNLQKNVNCINHYSVDGLAKICYQKNKFDSYIKLAIPFLVLFIGIISILSIYLLKIKATIRDYLLEVNHLSNLIKTNHISEIEKMDCKTEEGKILQNSTIAYISENKKNQDLEIQNQKSTLLAEIASQVAHDIRSPIMALNISLEHIESQSRVHNLITKSTQRINKIANDLLMATRHSDNVLENNSIESVLENISALIKEKEIEFSGSKKQIKINFNAKIQAESFKRTLDFNLTELLRILSNLMNNSVDAILAEGSLQIQIGMSDHVLNLAVIDNGKGIESSFAEQLFTKGATFGKDGGNGLGLYFAKRKIESAGGTIHLASKPGTGTTVSLAFATKE